MGLLVAFIAVLLGQCIAYEIFEEEKRQQLYPFPRIGRSSIWDFVEDKRLGGLVPFPRVGRTDGKRQGLIPFPRIGRSLDSDYDDSLSDIEDWLSETYDMTTNPFLKRASKMFQPRVGRRKRSIDQGDNQSQGRQSGKGLASDDNKSMWSQKQLQFPSPPRDLPYYSLPDTPDTDVLMMPARMMRGMFNPRIGKKVYAGEYDTQEANYEKRALIPRVGRADPSIQTRAMYPRVGRALIPRVGRSDKTMGHQANEISKD